MSIGADAASVGLPSRRAERASSRLLSRLAPTRREGYLALIAAVAGLIALATSWHEAGTGPARQTSVGCTMGIPGYPALRGTGVRTLTENGTRSTCVAAMPAGVNGPRLAYRLQVGSCTITVSRRRARGVCVRAVKT